MAQVRFTPTIVLSNAEQLCRLLRRRSVFSSHPAAVSVLLVDAHPVFRVGLRAALEANHQIRVVGEADDGRSAVRLSEDRTPEVVVMELDLADGSGLPAIRAIKTSAPRRSVLVVAARADAGAIVDALEAGADGYLPKSCPPDELRSAVLLVHAGERVLDRVAITALVDRAAARREVPPSAEALSARERDVLGRLASGATSKEIAAELGLRPKTVENHRARILDKLGAVNSAAAVRLAAAAGLIERDTAAEPALGF
jgi:two-component system, NarL family, response regulator NreC